MPFTIPDDGEGFSSIQSILFQDDIDCMVRGIQGQNYVQSGCLVTWTSGLNVSISLGTAVVDYQNVIQPVAAGAVGLGADPTNPRIYALTIDSAGNFGAFSGTPAATPKPPQIPVSQTLLAFVYVPAAAVALSGAHVVDKRFISGVIRVSLATDQAAITVVAATLIAPLRVRTPPGRYVFKYTIRYRSAATTTGVRMGVNHTGATSAFVWNQYWADVSAVASTAAPDQDQILGTGAVLGAFASRVKGATLRGVTLSVDTANADMMMLIEGSFINSTVGELELYIGSEVAASGVTIMAGSAVEVKRVG